MLSMQTFILKVSEFSYNVLVDNPQKHFAMSWMKMWIPISCLINIYVFLPSVKASEDPICNLNFETFASQFLSQKVWYTYWYTLSLWFWIWYENELIIFIMNDSGPNHLVNKPVSLNNLVFRKIFWSSWTFWL